MTALAFSGVACVNAHIISTGTGGTTGQGGSGLTGTGGSETGGAAGGDTGAGGPARAAWRQAVPGRAEWRPATAAWAEAALAATWSMQEPAE